MVVKPHTVREVWGTDFITKYTTFCYADEISKNKQLHPSTFGRFHKYFIRMLFYLMVWYVMICYDVTVYTTVGNVIILYMLSRISLNIPNIFVRFILRICKRPTRLHISRGWSNFLAKQQVRIPPFPTPSNILTPAKDGQNPLFSNQVFAWNVDWQCEVP